MNPSCIKETPSPNSAYFGRIRALATSRFRMHPLKGCWAFTGDDTGLMKRVRLSEPPGAAHRWGIQEPGGGVACCSWGPTGEDFVGVGLDSGVVKFWRSDGASDSPAFERSAHAMEDAIKMAGLHACGGDAHSTARVLMCDSRGCVRAWMWDGADGADSATSFDTGGTADFATFDEAGARVVVGGRDRELTLWDVAAGTCSYHARNVPHDNLDVPVPVWHSGARFMPGQPNVLASCTGFVQFRLRGEVRLYDVLAKRRPSVRALAPLGDEAVRSIACTPDGRYVLAGAVSGHMARLDVRKNLLPVNRYKGAAGSIRQIAIHPTLPLVASASLDRHVRLYQLEGTGALLQKVYLKQRLTAMMLSAEQPPKGAFAAAITSRASADEGEEGDEESGGDGDNVGAMLGALREVTDEGDEMGDELDENGDDDDDDDDDDGNAELDGFEEGADEAADDDDDDDEDEDVEEEEEEEESAPPPPVGNKRKTTIGPTAPKRSR